MEELQIFNNEEFGSVSCLVIDNEPWLVGKDVASALGGIDSRAYQLMSRKLFSNIWRDYKKYFKLGSYRDTLKTDYENAKNYLESWSPEVNTSLKIKEYNSQLAMNLDYNN